MIPSAGTIALRPFTSTDTPAAIVIYRDAVVTLGPQAYDPPQVAAWAQYPEDADAFGRQLASGVTLLACVDGEAVAFAQLHPSDHVQFLYCKGAYARRGLASRLYRELENAAVRAGVDRLTTDASRLSRPFFERFGFAVEHTERVERSGIVFERFRMTKPLA